MSATSRRFAAVPRSGIRTVLERAARVPGAVRLDAGDPCFATPAHIVEAALRAAAAGRTHYTPSAGVAPLRELIAAKLAARNGIACGADDVVVTAGACGGLFVAMLVLLDAGDEVLVPDPGWTGYPTLAASLGARAVPYRLDAGRGFALDLDEVAARIGPRTRAIVLNSPSNPTGAVLEPAAIEALVELAQRNGVWLLSDEAYEDVVFEGEHRSPAATGAGNVVSVFTLSKSYAMTGWRIGYVAAPGGLAASVARAQEAVASCVSSVSQAAAEAALAGPQDAVAEMREAYRSRRDEAVAQLAGAGLAPLPPRGAFYLLAATGGEDDALFAQRLLDEHEVAVVAGSAFGAGGRGSVRVSLCVERERLATGLERLVAALRPRALA